MKYGILLVNLGSPTAPTPKAVRKYLAQFLTDRRIIELSPLLWRPILHGIILRTRPAKSARNYEKIWDKDSQGNYVPNSLLLDITYKQAEALQNLLPKTVCVKAAMRYGQPSIETGLQALQDEECEHILVLPLYPQYAGATTESVYDAVKTAQKKLKHLPTITYADSYYDHPDYIAAISNSLEQHLRTLDWDPDEIFMSFHGLPKSSIKKGDPYEKHCRITYDLIKKNSPTRASSMKLTFQSRFGPKEWLGPYTVSALSEAAQFRKKNIVILTPGFAADCLETREELAITAKSVFVEQGGEKLSVAPCLNTDKDHINLLASIARKHLNLTG